MGGSNAGGENAHRGDFSARPFGSGATRALSKRRSEQCRCSVTRLRRDSRHLSHPGVRRGILCGHGSSYFEHGEHVELLSTSQCDPAQAVRVVVAYVNQNANRMHESFEVLAVEAIRDAWPCK